MAALPSPYCDTGDTASFTLSGTLEIDLSQNSTVRIGLRGSLATGTAWRVFVDLFPVGGGDWQADVYVHAPSGDNGGGFPPFPVLIQSHPFVVAPPPAGTYSDPISFSSTIGPVRLGAKLNLAAGGGPVDAPAGLAETNSLEHDWFADENSFFDEVMDTESELAQMAGAPQIITGDVGIFTATAGPGSPGVGVAIAKFTAVTINGDLLDTDGIDEAPLLDPEYVAVAAGAFNIMDVPAVALTAAPGVEIVFANNFVDYAGAASSPDILDNWLTQEVLFRGVPQTPQQNFVTNGTYTAPFTTNYPRATKNPPGAISHTITQFVDEDWLTDNGHDPEDTPVVLDQHSPISGALTYTPITVTHKGSIEVDTPTGGRPSTWAINSGANGSVTNNAGDTVFTVTNVAARFTRTFETNWREYSTGSQFDPEWAIDGYSFLKRHYGIDVRGITQTTYPEDVWWWNGYGFLKLNVAASAPATLTLILRGIDLQVSDSHNANGSQRAAELAFIEHADERTYVVDVPIGTNDVWIDLAFPDSYVAAGGAPFPMRRPRIDSLELYFDATGTFTLNSMELARRDSYATEVKVGYSPQSSYNDEWPGVYLRVDGEATPSLSYPDSAQKGTEAESGFGGSVRFAEPAQDSIVSARQMWEQLHRIEGFEVAYSDAARAAFHRDSFGVDLVTDAQEPSQFAKEVAPGATFAGAGDAHSYQPAHCIRVGVILFPNGVSVTIRGRKVFGGGVESVASATGARAGAGLNFDVLDQDDNTLGSVVSDTRGRIHFEPIGFDKTVRFVAA